MKYGGHLRVDYSFIKHSVRLYGGGWNHVDTHA